MTLVNRVSTFFLVALAIGLIVSSCAVFFSIRYYLYSEFDAQILTGMRVVGAAIEAEEDGVKWQPSEHTIGVGDDLEFDDVRWIIVDEQGRQIDHSANLNLSQETIDTVASLPKWTRPDSLQLVTQGSWRYVWTEITAPNPRPIEEREFDEFARIVLTVARPIDQLRQKVFRLGISCFALPSFVWIVAALVGRSYCQRALRPVHVMSAQIRDSQINEFEFRLPKSSQHDELAEMADAFNELLDRMQEAFQRQQRFSGDAAHQLKTPLTVLRGQIDVALMRSRSADQYREFLGTISEQTTQLQNIIESLLFLARDEGAHEHLQGRQLLPIDEWLATYAERWNASPRAESLSWNLQSNQVLNVSPTLLRQLLDNLIDNAIKYSPAETPIQISTSNHANCVAITVADSGPGIPLDDQHHIFEPFYRSPLARRQGIHGTGLGLSIVARIVKHMHGEITCESSAMNGTRFTITVPCS